jgi:ubiquinone/menaquinone biosynthesis C-methylase UbiE
MAETDYSRYVAAEWDQFEQTSDREHSLLDVTKATAVKSVLDVGCGAGQELLPFATKVGAFCVGLDVAPEVGHVGRELFSRRGEGSRVAFIRAAAEAVPFRSASFDVVICRLALPYTRNVVALSELARLVRPGGVILLRIHHPLFYLNKLFNGVRTADFSQFKYAVRVLLGGTIYLLTGHQPSGLIGREIFQTEASLKRELGRVGLGVKRKMSDSTTSAPSFLVAKELEST